MRNIGNLDLRQFMWLFFQGGLNFVHNKGCHHCGIRMSHQHIFFDCEQAQELWVKGRRAIDLICNRAVDHGPPRTRIDPALTEHTIWVMWSEYKPFQPALRLIVAATMYTIWHSRKIPDGYFRKYRPTLTNTISKCVEDSLAVARMERRHNERSDKIGAIQMDWNLSCPVWHAYERVAELSVPACKFIKYGPNNDLAAKLLTTLEKRRQAGLATWCQYGGYGYDFGHVSPSSLSSHISFPPHAQVIHLS